MKINLIDALLATAGALAFGLVGLMLILAPEPQSDIRRTTVTYPSHRNDDRPPPPAVEIPESLIWGR